MSNTSSMLRKRLQRIRFFARPHFFRTPMYFQAIDLASDAIYALEEKENELESILKKQNSN